MTNTVSESTILPISEIALLADVNIRELDTDYVSELIKRYSPLIYMMSFYSLKKSRMPERC